MQSSGAVVNKLVVVPLACFASLLASSVAVSQRSDECVYAVYVETGCNRQGGTDSTISLAISADSSGNDAIRIDNLQEWGGLMGANHKYFDRNNVDVFSGRGPCLSGLPCWMELALDGAGHRWYCNTVEVTATGPHMNCTKQSFTVEQWLARDRVPYQLKATRDYCRSAISGISVQNSEAAEVA